MSLGQLAALAIIGFFTIVGMSFAISWVTMDVRTIDPTCGTRTFRVSSSPVTYRTYSCVRVQVVK